MIKKFFISIIKSLIVLIIFALIFSGASSGVPQSINNIFSGIYDYASPDARKQVIGNLEENCNSLGQEGDSVTLQQLCSNRTMLESMKDNCKSYNSMKEYGMADNEKGMTDACEQIESKDFEKACEALKGKRVLSPDFAGLKTLCEGHKSNKTSDKDFFTGFVGNSFGSSTSSLGALDGYNNLNLFLNNNKYIYWSILLVLLIALYFLIPDAKIFIATLTDMLFGVGVLILLPYFLISMYDKLYGIDTSSILSGLFGGFNGLDPRSLISIMIVAFLQMYNKFIVILGSVMLAIGIIGKIYKFMSKSKRKTSAE